MAYKTLILEPHDHVLLIRLNRPEALNALNAELLRELAAALTEAEADPKVRVMVLTGSDKAFAAGADIREMASRNSVQSASLDVFGTFEAALARIRKPVIAAVNGYALGGGCELAMACDFVLCGDGAKFGQPEINLGILAGMGGSQRLTRLVGRSKSMDMHLTGRMMDAAEAERAGLASRIFPAKDLVTEALAVAAKIAAKSAVAARAVKEAVHNAEQSSLAEGLRFERTLFHSMFATEDQKEGMAAFLDKREPQFRDR